MIALALLLTPLATIRVTAQSHVVGPTDRTVLPIQPPVHSPRSALGVCTFRASISVTFRMAGFPPPQANMFSAGEGTDVGFDEGTAVSSAYEVRFKFKGKIRKVTVDEVRLFCSGGRDENSRLSLGRNHSAMGCE